MINPIIVKLLNTLACATSILVATTALATNSPIKPYEASYSIEADGIPFNSKATQRLIYLNDNTVEISLTIKAFLSKLEEHSLFTVANDCQIKAIEYRHYRRVFGSKKRYRINFDWDNLKAEYVTKKNSSHYTLVKGAVDRLSEQALIQCHVGAGATEFTVTVADKGSIKSRNYKVIGTEKLSVQGKSYDAIKVERVRENSGRSSTFWLDPNSNLTLVKMVQQEEDGEKYQLELEALKQ